MAKKQWLPGESLTVPGELTVAMKYKLH